MPFIEDDKLKLMQEDLDNAKLKREEAENELNKTQETFTSFKQKAKVIPIVLGLLLGFALGTSYYFFTNSGGSSFSSTGDDIAIAKKSEGLRVLDSVKRAQTRTKRKAKGQGQGNINEKSLDKTIAEVTTNTTGDTMYSVQIGVFSKNKFPLLSSKTIPSTVTSSNGYFKYSLGLFSTLKEAKKLKSELIKVGFKDAFVASYIDGKRQKIHN